MSPKWFIPLSIGAFVVLVGGPWAYLSLTQERFAGLDEPTHKNLFDDVDSYDRGRTQAVTASYPSTSDGEITPIVFDETDERGEKNKVAAPSRPRRAPLMIVLDRMDEASVRLRNDPNANAVIQYGRGVAAVRQGRPEEALSHFDWVLKSDPKNTAVLEAKAAALVELNRFDDAETEYARLTQIAPEDLNARYNHAVVLYRLSRFREAAEQLREVVRREPEHAEAHYNLASLAQREGRLAEARESLEVFTRRRPEVMSGWFNLGVVLMDLDLPQAAADCFKTVASADPLDADAHLNLGIAYSWAGEYDLALGPMERANELLPCDDTILKYLAALHDLLADQAGPESEEHRRIATTLSEQVDAVEDTP